MKALHLCINSSIQNLFLPSALPLLVFCPRLFLFVLFFEDPLPPRDHPYQFSSLLWQAGLLFSRKHLVHIWLHQIFMCVLIFSHPNWKFYAWVLSSTCIKQQPADNLIFTKVDLVSKFMCQIASFERHKTSMGDSNSSMCGSHMYLA